MDWLTGMRVFVRVVEAGGFSRAADDLAMSQPTVTKHVAAIEKALDCRLAQPQHARRRGRPRPARSITSAARRRCGEFDLAMDVGRDDRAEAQRTTPGHDLARLRPTRADARR